MTDTARRVDINDAITQYYKLKQTYNTKIEIQQAKISKNKSLSLKQKQARFRELRTVCVNCGQAGGTIFKNNKEYLTAVCGAASPCNLNINIYRGNYKNIYTQEKEVAQELNNLKEMVILIKLSLVFNIESKQVVLNKFEQIKKNLSKLSTTLFSLQSKIFNITLKPQNKVILDTAYNDLFQSKERLNKIISELNTTQNSRYAKDAAELFLSEITPLTEKIRNLKYSYVNIENNHLVESNYTLEQITQPVSEESSAKVISFIK